MKLPNRSHLVRVAQFRYVQSKREPTELANPDVFAGRMLSWSQRTSFNLYSVVRPRALRSRPFYYYLIARTRYYDQVFLDAVKGGANRYVLIVGCGGDTRPYRFAETLREKKVGVLECDQPEALRAKQRIVSRLWPTEHVEFLSINLNAASWPELDLWLSDRRPEPGLVILEGVSPYIDDRKFGLFLEFLSTSLHPDSNVAYDFKISGVNDQWGRGKGNSSPGFRLPSDHASIATYHEERGFSVNFFQLSGDLTRRWLPGLDQKCGPLYREDGLLQISPIKRNE